MNKFQRVGLAIFLASGMVFAAGSIWRVGAPYGIAQFDWIKECLASSDFDETDSNSPCYKDHGGWWFGMVYGPSSGPPAPAICDLKRGEATKSNKANGGNYVEAYINGEWVSFVGNDYDNCEGPPFTDKEAGGAYLIDYSLDFIMNVGSGDAETYNPAGAAIGLNFSQPPRTGDSPPTDRDFTAKRGFCMAYEIEDLDNPAALIMELKWNEDDAGHATPADEIPYDAWTHPVPIGSGVLVKDFLWTNFEQEGWSSGPWPLSKATSEMRAVAISLKTPKPYTPVGPIKFKLRQFGFAGECDETACPREGCDGEPNPIVSGIKAVANMSLKQTGRIFSLQASAGKPVAVQVINLQGAIVHSQTMSANGTMNLSNLPTGIYMLRIPSQGYTSKVILK